MMLKNSFKLLLDQQSPIILDGGLATQLECQGHDLNSSLWSAALLQTNPQAIIDAHLAYLKAGAQIITSASYQASISGFQSIGLSVIEAQALIEKSVWLACKSVEYHCSQTSTEQKPLVAASIGPYGAWLADGSEYTGQYGVEQRTLLDFHYQRLILLDNSMADILACETIPSIEEAQVLAKLLGHLKTPAWVSFSCSDEKHLNDGTEIEKAVESFADIENVFALGVNCTAPEFISPLVERIKSVQVQKAIIVYPNSGDVYDPQSKTWAVRETPDHIEARIHAWLQQGVKIIGGCCRIGPAEIGKLKLLLQNR